MLPFELLVLEVILNFWNKEEKDTVKDLKENA